MQEIAQAEQIMLFHDHTNPPSSSSLHIRFQHVDSLITGIAFIDVIIVTGISSC